MCICHGYIMLYVSVNVAGLLGMLVLLSILIA